MKKQKLNISGKSLPLSTPISRPLTKKELDNLKEVRHYGVVDLKKYLVKLKDFIAKKVTQKVIDQDLNTLLPNRQFQNIRKTLKQEVLVLLGDEIKRLTAPEKM